MLFREKESPYGEGYGNNLFAKWDYQRDVTWDTIGQFLTDPSAFNREQKNAIRGVIERSGTAPAQKEFDIGALLAQAEKNNKLREYRQKYEKATWEDAPIGGPLTAETIAKLQPFLSPTTPSPRIDLALRDPRFDTSPDPRINSQFWNLPGYASATTERPRSDFAKAIEALGGNNSGINLGLARATTEEDGQTAYTPWSFDDIAGWVYGNLGGEKLTQRVLSGSKDSYKDLGRYTQALEDLTQEIWAEQEARARLFGPNDPRSVVPLGADNRYLKLQTYDPTRGDFGDKYTKYMPYVIAAPAVVAGGAQALAALGGGSIGAGAAKVGSTVGKVLTGAGKVADVLGGAGGIGGALAGGGAAPSAGIMPGDQPTPGLGGLPYNIDPQMLMMLLALMTRNR